MYYEGCLAAAQNGEPGEGSVEELYKDLIQSQERDLGESDVKLTGDMDEDDVKLTVEQVEKDESVPVSESIEELNL